MTRKKTKLLISLLALVLIGLAVSLVVLKKEPPENRNSSDADKSAAVPSPNLSLDIDTTPGASTAQPSTSFNKTRYSLDDPTSLWVVVNKKRPLPSSYTPSGLVGTSGIQLRSEAATATSQLIAAAKASGVSLKGISGYRSYASQQSVYNSYVQKDGRAAADTYSARPGHSEHQTGLAADLGNSNGSCDLEICFANTAGGKWLAAHAHEYGFTIRYPEGKTGITGYQYEPWHIRYVGKELSTELKNKNQTMEEFFGLAAAPSY